MEATKLPIVVINLFVLKLNVHTRQQTYGRNITQEPYVSRGYKIIPKNIEDILPRSSV